MTGPSFANDIAPTLYPYRGQMAWRFDLADYGDVKANAAVILEQITWDGGTPSMPPPPFSPFSKEFVAQFEQWMVDYAP